MTPNTGYSIASVTPTGCTGMLTGNIFTTDPIVAACSVAASFTLNSYTVTATSGAGGGISPSNALVAYGAKTTFTVTPSVGYTASVTGCGGTLTGNSYTTNSITANCTVAVSFAINNYTVTATSTFAAAGGITPGSSAVAYGATATFAVTPNAGISIAGVTASGCIGTLVGNTFTTGPITANCSVTARFTIAAATSISTGDAHTCALTSVGTVYCWGSNQYGQLGNGNTTNFTAPVKVIGLSGPVSALAAGRGHSCALTNAGAVQCWGQNNYGQLGNGNLTDSTSPVTVNGLSNPVTALAAGYGHTCALTVAGEIQCWGDNGHGELGNGSNSNSSSPLTVIGLSGLATALAVKHGDTCALISAAAVQCWGAGSDGQLGNGSSGVNAIVNPTPVTVIGLGSPVLGLATGHAHTCALTGAGAAQCWGYNFYGELGNGRSGVGTDSATPVLVAGLGGLATAVAAGSGHTCVTTSAGIVQCWGYNQQGQLGNGSVTNSAVPVAVIGLSGPVTALAAGAYNTCALTSAGAVQCWGYNLEGELGNGSLSNTPRPTNVLGFGG